MKIFVDTNIFLDLLLKRDGYKDALKIVNAVADKKYKAMILDITILNIDYIAKKQVKDIRSFLTLINENFEVVGVTNSEIKKALELQNNDLEDNLQYISAVEFGCDLIISNDATFYPHGLEVLTASEFNPNHRTPVLYQKKQLQNL